MSKNTNIKIDWKRIIDASQNLLDMAKYSRWEEMPEAATQRDKLIRNFFNENPATHANAENLQKFLQEILDIDKKLISLTTHAQTSLGSEISEFHKGKNATQAYNNCP